MSHMVNPQSPCKIKFPEIYSLIFSSEPALFCTTTHHISECRVLSPVTFRQEHQKHFVWLTKLSVARFILFLRIIKKGGQCKYIRPWMNRGAWQCYIQTGSGSARGGEGWGKKRGKGRRGCRRRWNTIQTCRWMSSSSYGMVPRGHKSKFPVWSTNPRMSCEWVWKRRRGVFQNHSSGDLN